MAELETRAHGQSDLFQSKGHLPVGAWSRLGLGISFDVTFVNTVYHTIAYRAHHLDQLVSVKMDNEWSSRELSQC